MSIDKFGHFSNDRDFSSLFKRELESLTGVYLDTDGHINVQKKRIKNSSHPINGHDLAIKQYVDEKINSVKLEQTGEIVKSFEFRNKRVSDLESKVIKTITQIGQIDVLMTDFFDRLENVDRFINSYLRNPPPNLSTQKMEIEGTLVQKSPFAHREKDPKIDLVES